MYGRRMRPTCFEAIFLLEDWIRNDKLALSAELKQKAPIVVIDTNAVLTKDSFPGHWVPPNTSIEAAKYQDLIICRNIAKMSAQIRIETVFGQVRCRLLFNGRHMDVMWLEWHIGDVSNFLLWILHLRRPSADGFPDQKQRHVLEGYPRQQGEPRWEQLCQYQ